ncbi:Serine/threonine-protein kinase Aurora-3 [Diplonema papillatum]|nr:Serine/threonine-protein kinase Aurora-3 [Diplonema papillatum]|eukprot:gene23019-35270_t
MANCKKRDDDPFTRVGADGLQYCPAAQARAVGLADFDLSTKLGQGVAGEVFRARDKQTNAIVAIKRIKVSEVQRLHMGDQVRRELAILRELRHPNINRMLTYFWEGDHIFIVLEYASGGDTYRRLMRHKRFSVETTARLIAQVAEALRYAHSAGVVHRDIKPENILLDHEGNAKLADFGWGVRDEAGEPRSTFCGTPDYIPPEMVAGEAYGRAVDNWCLGVLAYEFLHGRAPFFDADDEARCRKIAAVDFAHPAASDAPAAAKDFVQRLLRADPRERMSLDEALRHPFIVEHRQKGPRSQ